MRVFVGILLLLLLVAPMTFAAPKSIASSLKKTCIAPTACELLREEAAQGLASAAGKYFKRQIASKEAEELLKDTQKKDDQNTINVARRQLKSAREEETAAKTEHRRATLFQTRVEEMCKGKK